MRAEISSKNFQEIIVCREKQVPEGRRMPQMAQKHSGLSCRPELSGRALLELC
jgi:hypothetical protein